MVRSAAFATFTLYEGETRSGIPTRIGSGAEPPKPACAMRNPLPKTGPDPPSAETPGLAGDFPAVIPVVMDTHHLSRLRARARRLSRSPQDAEDLCHEVCLAMLEREAAGATITQPLPYMMTALRHAAAARSRRMARETPMETAFEPQVEDATLACLCSEVLARMDDLPALDRALLRRVGFEGVTPSELAEELDVPVGTIMSRLARARARLRDAAGIRSVF